MRIIMLIVVALVMAFVMFGKNPIKEMQKQELARRAKYGTDSLTQETNMYIERKKSETGTSLGYAPVAGKIAPPEEESLDSAPNSANSGATPAGKNGDLPSPPKISGYYPPIIGGNDAASGAKIDVNKTQNEQKLRSGQSIGFDGMDVYAIDKSGKRAPLPDGKYTLYDGSLIEVHGGRRVQTTSH